MAHKKIALVIAVLVLIIGVGVGVMYVQKAAPVTVDYPIESVRDGTYTGTLPPLDREVNYGAAPEEVKVALRAKIESARAEVKDVPYDGNRWMNLALYYHSANDYAAAAEVWDFIVSVTPTNVTALNNLGRLYHFDLRDFPKAESYFMKAIEVNPDRPEAYFELFDLYRYSYKKNTSAAVDIMLKGAQKFTNNYSFYAGIGVYYRELGNSAKARVYFEKALTVARAENDVSGIGTLTKELSTLP